MTSACYVQRVEHGVPGIRIAGLALGYSIPIHPSLFVLAMASPARRSDSEQSNLPVWISMNTSCFCAGGLGECCFKLAFGVNVERQTAAEHLDQPVILPGLNIVVGTIADHTLNRVAVVVQQEDDRHLAVAGSWSRVPELIWNEPSPTKSTPAGRARPGRSQRCPDGVADRPVERLPQNGAPSGIMVSAALKSAAVSAITTSRGGGSD